MTGRKLLLLILLAALVFAGVAGYGDFRNTLALLRDFPVAYLAGALGLAAVNFGLRFCRWAYYLKVLGLRAPARVSVLVFLSGLAMSVTPGKAGEFFKCHLLRDRTGIPVAASAPVVVMERLTDVVSVLMMAMIGFALLPAQVLWVLAVVFGLCLAALIPILSRRGGALIDLPPLRRWKEGLQTSREGLRILVRPRVLTVAIALGLGAWVSEGFALWLILDGMNSDIDLFRALPIYGAATLVGAATTIPGGLVGTEGIMVALLQESGALREAASAGTILVRLATLWFAVAVGLVALASLNKSAPMTKSAASGGESEITLSETSTMS